MHTDTHRFCFVAQCKQQNTQTATRRNAETVHNRSTCQKDMLKTGRMKYISHPHKNSHTHTDRQRKGKCKYAGSTLRSSRAVPHPSINQALRRFTSEVGRDPVHSTRYGRPPAMKLSRMIVKSYCQQVGCVVVLCKLAHTGAAMVLGANSKTHKQPQRDMQRLSTAAATAKTTLPKHAA